MSDDFPLVISELYFNMVGSITTERLPEYLQNNPVQGKSMWAFWQGLRLGIQIMEAVHERE